MKKEIFNFDLAKGVKTFDTSKMDEWTEAEWKEFIGDPTEDIVPLNVLLVDDDEITFEIIDLYFNDFEEYIIVVFKIYNKNERDINVQFNRWNLDDQQFDLSSELPYFIKRKSRIDNIKISVNYMFFDVMTLEVSILESETDRVLRKFEFNIST